MSDEQQNINNGGIMRELSIIKSSLAVQTSETVNIKDSISEIKLDIKDIKTNYINQEQHRVLSDCTEDHEIRLRCVEGNITKILTWGSAIILLIAIIEFVLTKYF